ncbi:flagellar biosynthesis protein FliQ [Actinokineospora auranticolor]|uniref:Flagellar biosynthetic protein FliQ n=1 Tax=Actinokineospora auranticolor TaxID=155976 RepID=A0A2S6GMN2_9PSEU|nr:flagellar biosynthesis protein FliQ [Actinokineospora auranticolor]PPK66494.1 flagellar biosynthetic protein FliQ [Actinokineospora auranticolor]
MNDTTIIELGMQAMLVTAKLAAPMLLTALVVGFAISLFQSVTQIQEVTLSFVPKAIGCALALLLCGSWMLREIVNFTGTLYERIPALLHG